MSTDHSHPLFARLLVWMGRHAPPEELERRRRLLDGLSGRVLDLGAGDGANFEHFPATVTSVVAVEPEPYLRERAVARAAGARVPIEVVDGLADHLPLEDGSVDAAVTALVLCSVPDQATALAELRRVIRPGGELRFFEHVAADGRALRATQAAVDRSGLWPRLFGGCHTSRDTAGAIAAAGFAVESSRRLSIPPRALPISPCVVGVARRPA